jgi:hypothetical protein
VNPFGQPPSPGAQDPWAAAPPPEPQNPFAAPTGSAGGFGGTGPGPAETFNPYQSPVQTGHGFQQQGPGPPWERDGASSGSFFATVKQQFGDVGAFFRDMRREGGIGMPMWFGVIGGMIGMVVSVIYQLIFQVVMATVMNGPAGGQDLAAGAAGMGCIVVLGPAILIVLMFVYAGIHHLMLMMLGGANRPFETTFRVEAYAMGATALLLLIPVCGQYINGIVQLVFTGIGLCYAHETDGWRATLAVLLPIIVCCLLAIGIVAAIFGIAANT